jgi:KAP family P-loop domain
MSAGGAQEAEVQEEVDVYDVYLAHAAGDSEIAMQLTAGLTERGYRCASRHARVLRGVRTLVVIWSRAAVADVDVLRDAMAFEALAGPRSQRVLVLITGTAAEPPWPLSERKAHLLDRFYGGLASNEGMQAAIDLVVQFVESQEFADAPDRGISTTARAEFVSTAARQALSAARVMLDSARHGERGRRTAALLASLLVSSREGMAPSTGELVKLVQERQRGVASVETLILKAARAARLATPSKKEANAQEVAELERSSVAPLLDEAFDIRGLTGAQNVSLRHVVATALRGAATINPEALAELGVTLPELRERWRQSIAATWPKEAQAVWDELFAEPESEAFAGTLAGRRLALDSPPSAHVHADRWTTEDNLDYALYARAIAEFIRHPDAKPPLVISVQAPWGQGKTSLMRMVQSNLDPDHPDLGERAASPGAEPASEVTFADLLETLDGEQRPTPTPKPKSFRTVWFNAWKYESSEQVWAGLAHAILSQLPARLSTRERELFWLRLQWRRIDAGSVRRDVHRAILERFLPRALGWLGLALLAAAGAGGALFATSDAGFGFGAVATGLLAGGGLVRGAWSRARRDVLERPLEGAYLRYVRQPDYASRMGYLHLVEEDMTRALDLLAPEDQPVVIFIDDLDRCSPAKIGEVIEAVNLFLAGEYPNCAFVIGIDAEVVAASMAVLHERIIGKLPGRHGELGWRFMDKFIQLPFVMPRLHARQREAYLRGLFKNVTAAQEHDLVRAAAELTTELNENARPIEELARRAGELAGELATVAPDRARELGETVVAAGARAFKDDDPEVVQALADQIRHLSDNPRTIKRAVNLYRFHRFAAFARQASALPLDVATPQQIGRWVVVIVRWPQFVRWLQAEREETDLPARDPAARVMALASAAPSALALRKAFEADEIEGSWIDDVELLDFLREETDSDLDIALASPCGLW